MDGGDKEMKEKVKEEIQEGMILREEMDKIYHAFLLGNGVLRPKIQKSSREGWLLIPIADNFVIFYN